MKKVLIPLLGIMTLMTFCSFFGLFSGGQKTPSTKAAYKISNDVSKILKKKYGLDFIGIFEEGSNGKYTRIGFDLTYDKLLSKDQGRKLMMNCAQDILYAFNSNSEFHQHMENVPFTYDNIVVRIYIKPPPRSEVYFPDIGVFSFYNEKLWFKTNSPNNEFQYYTTENETVEEAKQIVEAQMNSQQYHDGY